MTWLTGGREVPMTTVSIHEAKIQPSRLIARVEGGEEVVIARAGQPVARPLAVRSTQPRRPGALKGRIRIGDAFDDPSPEDEWQAWEA